jgi:diguanylate cyclase (GGDEF)-like protein
MQWSEIMTSQALWRRILIIDDNEAIHADIRKILLPNSSSEEASAMEAAIFGNAPPANTNPQYEIESAMQGREGCNKAHQAVQAGRPFAMAFVDMRMPPGWDGLETIHHLFEVDSDIQVVVCTAYSDYSWEQMLDKLGMTDRVLLLKKPFDRVEIRQLAAALTEKWKLKRQAELKVGELEAMVHARTHELREQALHDRLTGLPNRAYVLERVNAAIRDSKDKAEAGETALLFIDFDRFKSVNDSLGHDIGDELLIEISVRLRGLINSWTQSGHAAGDSFAARLGGDEFVVFLDCISDIHEARQFADRVLETLNVPYCLKGYDVQNTASIGIARRLGEYRRAEELLRDADLAMFRAKRAGGGRFIEFDHSMRDAATHRLNLETDLRQAVKREEFFVVYQPIVELESGALRGFEALLRWQHETRGVIMPGEFIPIAEESNLIVPMGQITVEIVCRQIAQWRRSFPNARPFSVSVNVSQKHFNNSDLVSCLSKAVRRHNVSPQCLKVEVTESAVMTNHEEGREIMKHITDLGIELHMDDFGTGYSSLNCLHGLPLHCLKIDRSFIVTMTLKRDYAAVISAIIQLAHNLGMRVVAEGVETREQVIMLQALGCDEGQGFFFSKPVSAEEASKYFKNAEASVPQFSMAVA